MADGDLERRLGEVLRDRARGFTPSGDLPERIGARTRQRAHNRRVAASMAAVAVLLGIAAPLALRDGGDDQETATLAVAPATTAAGAADAPLSDAAGATSRAGEGGADTTAAAADEAVAAPDTVAAATEGAPATASPPAPAPTSTVAAAAEVASAPPFLLAIMPGDDRVALVSTQTSQVVRYVEDADHPAGDVFYDDAGEIVFRAGGCSTTAQGEAVASDDVVMTDAAWRDAVAITAWGGGPSQRFAWVTDNRCNGGSGFTLTLRTSAGDRMFRVPDVRALAFSPDGTTVAWIEPDGLALLDVTNPQSDPVLLAKPDLQCEFRALAFARDTALRVIARCESDTSLAFIYELDPPDASPATSFAPLPAEVDVTGLDIDQSGEWQLLDGSTVDGTAVSIVGLGLLVAEFPGAQSPHWTTATG